MRFTLLTIAVMSALMTGCATRDFSSKTLAEEAQSRTTAALRDTLNHPARPSSVNDIDEPYLEFKAVKPQRLEGTLTLKAAASPVGPLLMDTAKKAGYSVVFAENVDAMRKVTAEFNRADPEQAIRQMAFLAGYVAVLDKVNKTFTIAETATYTFKVPTSVFQQLYSQYAVGGNPVTSGSSSGSGSGGSSSSSSGGSSSSMQATFVINGKEGSSAAAVQKLITDIAGKNAEVNVSEIGIISVRSNAQSLRRVQTFLQSFVKDAMTQVDIEASIVEVNLQDDFQYGINWNRVLSSTKVFGSAGALSVNLANPAITNPGLTANFTGANIGAVITALRDLTDTKVVSQPHILAVNDTPSSFFDGTQIPYLGSISTTTSGTANSTQTSGSTAYAVDGISFSVQPHVMDDSHVQLTLIPVISSVGQMTNFQLGSSGSLQVPQQSSKQSFMKVMAEDGKTIILGGIRYSVEGATDNASPIPGVPIGRNSNKRAKEMVILLRTHIIPSPEFDPVVAESI